MDRARGGCGPQKHSKTLSNIFLFWFRGQPHHSSQQYLLDGPSPWSPREPETFENPAKPLNFVSEASHIIPASRMGWMGRARGGPRNIQKACQTSQFCFRGQPHHSSQQNRLDGPSPWVPWAPETFENPVKLLYFYVRMRRGYVRVRRGYVRVWRGYVGCGVAMLGCGVAKSGCGMALWLARRAACTAVPGSNPARHPSLGSAQENPGAEI